MFRVCLVLLLLALVVPCPAVAQSAPELGTALRGAILDGLRAGGTDVHRLERDVLFRVHKLAVLDDYALTPVSPLGDTIYAFGKDLECDRQINVLVQFRETEWEVVERDVGPCDSIWRAVFEQTAEYPGALLRYWEEMSTAD